EWTAWRMECVRRRTFFELSRKQERLHLLKGLEKILLDIDKAIAIIRNTELEQDVVPNLMVGFGIDKVQAEYVAEIKLRNINREYILKRTEDIKALTEDIKKLGDILNSKNRIRKIIISELKAINSKYVTPRKTEIVYSDEIEEFSEEESVPDYPVNVFISREGYIKKITPQSLKLSSEQKYKEGDGPDISYEASNASELLVFTDRQQAYKLKLSELEDTKASVLGTYLPSKLGFEDGENYFTSIDPGDYHKEVLLFFADGKCARFSLSSFETKQNRRKLVNAYSAKSPAVKLLPLDYERDIVCFSDEGRALIFSSSLLATKATRSTAGVSVMTLKKNRSLTDAQYFEDSLITNISRYRAANVPARGAVLRDSDRGEQQMTLL
ncbi:MAG: topoisomerase IV, partial [Oscillospiraceae bacterium]|nr:topoisomerase IV [Oscillospiraceae bacterium]